MPDGLQVYKMSGSSSSVSMTWATMTRSQKEDFWWELRRRYIELRTFLREQKQSTVEDLDPTTDPLSPQDRHRINEHIYAELKARLRIAHHGLDPESIAMSQFDANEFPARMAATFPTWSSFHITLGCMDIGLSNEINHLLRQCPSRQQGYAPGCPELNPNISAGAGAYARGHDPYEQPTLPTAPTLAQKRRAGKHARGPIKRRASSDAGGRVESVTRDASPEPELDEETKAQLRRLMHDSDE